MNRDREHLQFVMSGHRSPWWLPCCPFGKESSMFSKTVRRIVASGAVVVCLGLLPLSSVQALPLQRPHRAAAAQQVGGAGFVHQLWSLVRGIWDHDSALGASGLLALFRADGTSEDPDGAR
jgi:hypothetical protein